MENENILHFESDEQKTAFIEKINPENCGEKLKLIRNSLYMSKRELAKVLGCSESTISRIENKKTKPSMEFMNRLLSLVYIGYAKYKSLNTKEKQSLNEYLVATGGTMSGIGGAISAVSASGAVSGLSAAGITSGLAAIGGTMIGGVAVVASIPIVAGLSSYGIFKGIKSICNANNLSCEEVDGRFEIIRKRKKENTNG